MPTQADTPHSLVRRYEVCIIPFAAAKARKLREIKAVGKSLSAHLHYPRYSTLSQLPAAPDCTLFPLSRLASLQTSDTW
jgi:hypothetical protein